MSSSVSPAVDAAAPADVVKPDFSARFRHFLFNDEHDQLRETVRAFVTKEVLPHAEEWEETTFPDSIIRRMGELGFLGLDKPEEYGGQGGDYASAIVFGEEMVYGGSGGLTMGVAVQTDMALPPILKFGTEEQKQEWAVPAIAGTKILSLGITEPDAGSDVAGIKTRAVRDGDDFVINGSKTYITNGHRSDVIVLVTKTDVDAGYDGFTLFLVPMDAPGVIREKRLQKLGMHASDTALLAFQDVRVPASAMLGTEGKGFYHIMWELQGERLIGAAGCVSGCPAGLRPDARLRQGAHGVRARDRPLPGHPPQVRRDGDEDRDGAADGPQHRLARAERRVPGARDLDGQALRGADRLRGRRRVHPDPRRRGLHEGVRRRARLARHAPEPHRRGHGRDHARRDRPELRAVSLVEGEGYAVGALDDLGEGYGFRKVRKGLGVTAFGVNAIVMPPGYDSGRHFHDEQEELYFVHAGEAEMTFGDGSSHRLGPGSFARVDPATVRGVRSVGDGDLVYVCVGAKDGYVGRDGHVPEE